jgi:hypothetical protein
VLENGVRDLIRTIWLASLCLATLGGLLATKIVSETVSEPVEAVADAAMAAAGPPQDTPVRDITVQDAPVQATAVQDALAKDTPVKETPVQDTLTAADRIVVSAFADPAEHRLLPPIAAAMAQWQPVKPKRTAGSIAGRNRTAPTAGKPAVPLPTAKPKSKLAKKNGPGVDPAKTVSEIKPCRQYDPITRLLAVAGIASRCDT